MLGLIWIYCEWFTVNDSYNLGVNQDMNSQKTARINGSTYTLPSKVYIGRIKYTLTSVTGRGKSRALHLTDMNGGKVISVPAMKALISRQNEKNKFLVASANILYDVLVSRGCGTFKTGVLVNELVYKACMYEREVGTALISVALNFSTLIPSKIDDPV